MKTVMKRLLFLLILLLLPWETMAANTAQINVTVYLPPTLVVVSPHGSPTPAVGAHTLTLGSLVNASVSGSPEVDASGITRYISTGWRKMTGTSPASGLTTQTAFNVNRDTTLTWTWKTQHQLSAPSSPLAGGRVTLADGVTTASGTWHDAATTVTLKAMANPGWVFLGWSGDASGTSNSVTLVMDHPQSVTASFAKIPVITLQPISRTVNPGTSVSFGVNAGGSAPLEYQWCKNGIPLSDGGTLSGATTSTLHISSAAESDEGNYSCLVSNIAGSVASSQASLTINPTLMVISNEDNTVPTIGLHVYPINTMVNASATTETDALGTTRWICTGWTAVGATPTSGNTATANFTIDEPTTLTWHWKTQYKLTVTTDPATSGTITLGNGTTSAGGWYDANTSLTVKAIAKSNSRFVMWWGDLSGRTNPTGLPMDHPHSIGAHFDSLRNDARSWRLYQ